MSVGTSAIKERNGRLSLDFEDFEGQRFRMVIDEANKVVPWHKSPVPAERQIIGLGPISMAVPRLDRTEAVLTQVMNMRKVRSYPAANGVAETHVFEMGPGGPGAELHVKRIRPPGDLGPDALGEGLRALLDWDQRQQLERFAPSRIRVPSGMERRIDYALEHDGSPQPPVLAVKLQELFGLGETPTIAEGRVPLTLHLLSPAGRPLQVTRDLRGFWERTWPEVRREMKGRYPKHPWPEDPWNAVATHRAKPRGT